MERRRRRSNSADLQVPVTPAENQAVPVETGRPDADGNRAEAVAGTTPEKPGTNFMDTVRFVPVRARPSVENREAGKPDSFGEADGQMRYYDSETQKIMTPDVGNACLDCMNHYYDVSLTWSDCKSDGVMAKCSYCGRIKPLVTRLTIMGKFKMKGRK